MLALPQGYAHAQPLVLPPAGEKVGLSQAFQPAVLSALTVDPQNPLEFQFYIDPGQDPLLKDRQDEYLLLVKDFMASLTVPEDQLWVNLSPYEKDRIIDERFGLTDMGRDLLAQDYILKQITASLIYPEEGIGRDFWAEIYRRAEEQFGTIDIPVDTFNKVWIMPDVAEVYQQGMSAVVLKAHLKVMLEADYLAIEHNAAGDAPAGASTPSQELTKQVLREVIVPVLEKEVNTGRNFARLRQIYNALILAAWYKKTMRESFLGRAYVDQSKVNGIIQRDPGENARIYAQYVEALQKGVFNYIKEEVDRHSGEAIPRKYFSGGVFVPKGFTENLVVRRTIDRAEKNGKKKASDAVKVSLRNTSMGIDNFVPAAEVDPKNGTLNIGRIKEVAKKIYELESAARNDFLRVANNEKFLRFQKEQRSLVKAAFKRMIDGQEQADFLIETFNSFLDPQSKTGLNSLALSGEYTMDVFDQFMALSLFSRSHEKVAIDKVLELAGLESALAERFRSAWRFLKTKGDHSGFYNSLRSRTVKSEAMSDSKNIFLRENFSDMPDLMDRRDKDPEFHFEDVQGRVAWVQQMVRSAERLLPKAYNLLINLTGLSKGNEMKNLLYGRAKSEESLDNKLVLTDQGPNRIIDQIAYRLAGRSLNDLEEKDDQIMSAVVKFSEYLDEMAKKENFFLQRKGPSNVAKLREIREQMKNFIYPEKTVVVRRASYFKDNERIPWYKGFHYVFMLGDSLWTVELQLKTLRQAVLHDIEHKLHYSVVKRDKKYEANARLYENLIAYIWFLNSIELMNYVYSKDPQLAEKALDEEIQSLDKSQAGNAKEPVKIVRHEGGIDVRDVQGSLDVRGQRFGADTGLFDIKAGERVNGFSPVIISVVPVEGIPFLMEQSPPTGVFSRN